MRTKVVHLLRGLYPSEGLELARAYDLMLRAGVCHAAGVDVLSDVQFSIARLPLKSGGCGLGFAEDMVDAAYVASVAGKKCPKRSRVLIWRVCFLYRGDNRLGFNTLYPNLSFRFAKERSSNSYVALTHVAMLYSLVAKVVKQGRGCKPFPLPRPLLWRGVFFLVPYGIA